MRLHRLIIIAAFLLLPLSTSAKEVTLWEFSGGSIPGEWTAGSNISLQPTEWGAYIAAAAEGAVKTPFTLPHRTDMVRLSTLAPVDTEAIFIWQSSDMERGSFVRLPFVIPRSAEPADTFINLNQYPQWDPHAEMIGFLLPRNAEIVVHEMEFTGLNPFDKTLEAIRSFFVPDTLGSYSINFLWGPLLVFTEAGRMELFSTLPPFGWSVMRIVYPILLVVGALSLYFAFAKHNKAKATMLFFSTLFGMWILFDVRMAYELTTYAIADWQDYILEEPNERNFRGLQNLEHILEDVSNQVQNGEKFGFVMQDNLPIFSLLRYSAFPGRAVTREYPEDLRLWVVFESPAVSVGEDGRLYDANRLPISKPGTIIMQYNDYSFLFETQ